MLIRVAEQLVTHASVESTLEVGDIRCTCSVGRQRVPQWNATNREAALSQICRNDGGKHLVTVPSGSAMGRTLEQSILINNNQTGDFLKSPVVTGVFV